MSYIWKKSQQSVNPHYIKDQEIRENDNFRAWIIALVSLFFSFSLNIIQLSTKMKFMEFNLWAFLTISSCAWAAVAIIKIKNEK